MLLLLFAREAVGGIGGVKTGRWSFVELRVKEGGRARGGNASVLEGLASAIDGRWAVVAKLNSCLFSALVDKRS